MPSLEMLKKLLDEFTEKEAQNREEMIVINEQVAELEKRIEASKKRLTGVAADRERVKAMMAHYASWGLAPAGSEKAAPPAPTKGREPRRSKKEQEPAAAEFEVGPEPSFSSVKSSPRASFTRLQAMNLKEPEPPQETAPPPSTSPFFPTPDVMSSSPPVNPFAAMGQTTAENPPSEVTASPSVANSIDWTMSGPPPAAETAKEPKSGYEFGYQETATNQYVAQRPPEPPSEQATPIPDSNPFFSQTPVVREPAYTAPAREQQAPPNDLFRGPNPMAQPEFEEQSNEDTAQNQAPAQDETAAPQIQDLASDDETDDTVKSINDALRGLFR